MDLSGKVAIVTGGAQGLGYGFAEGLLRRGCRVCLADLKQVEGQAAAAKFQQQYGEKSAVFVVCDVTNSQQFTDAFSSIKETFGHIDIVVNNAGISDEQNWEKMVDVNLNGVIRGTRLGIEYMSRTRGGRGGIVINIGSTAGLAVVNFAPVYVGTKHGVVSYTRSVAGYLDTYEPGHGVQVNCLCPSFTSTDMLSSEGIDDKALNLIGSLGTMRPSRVVDAFMQLIDDPGRHGGVLTVIPKSIKYKFPGSKI